MQGQAEFGVNGPGELSKLFEAGLYRIAGSMNCLLLCALQNSMLQSSDRHLIAAGMESRSHELTCSSSCLGIVSLKRA
jgi:hypothetical protein